MNVCANVPEMIYISSKYQRSGNKATKQIEHFTCTATFYKIVSGYKCGLKYRLCLFIIIVIILFKRLPLSPSLSCPRHLLLCWVFSVSQSSVRRLSYC